VAGAVRWRVAARTVPRQRVSAMTESALFAHLSDALKALGASIERFGAVEPLVVNRRRMTVVGGHQRLRVLRSQKVKEARSRARRSR
jgi:ParB-like chromosome segregation protein Spo0J